MTSVPNPEFITKSIKESAAEFENLMSDMSIRFNGGLPTEDKKTEYIRKMRDHAERQAATYKDALRSSTENLKYRNYRPNVPNVQPGSRSYDVAGARVLVFDRTGRQIKVGSLVYVDFERGPTYNPVVGDVHGYIKLKNRFFIVESIRPEWSCPIQVMVNEEIYFGGAITAKESSYWLTSEEVLCVDEDEPEESGIKKNDSNS